MRSTSTLTAAGVGWPDVWKDRPPRTIEQKMATTQISAEARKARLMPSVKAREIDGSRCPTVPRKTSASTAGGIEAAVTANPMAKLKIMPTLRSVFSVAAATPRRVGGAALIVVLVLADQKKPLPVPISVSASPRSQ